MKKLRSDLKMVADPANVLCEGHAIKQFQTLINKRLYASSKKRDLWLCYSILCPNKLELRAL